MVKISKFGTSVIGLPIAIGRSSRHLPKENKALDIIDIIRIFLIK
tara:strand:- start:35856 stop:35990 length:135 start_codon:yes stop_codon:yes gene_type:complete